MEQWPPRHSFDLVIGADVVYLEDEVFNINTRAS